MFVKFNGNSGGRLWNRRWYRALNYKRIYDGFNLIINRHIELRENEEKEKRKKGQKQIYIYVYRESRVKEMEGKKKKKRNTKKERKKWIDWFVPRHRSARSFLHFRRFSVLEKQLNASAFS